VRQVVVDRGETPQVKTSLVQLLLPMLQEEDLVDNQEEGPSAQTVRGGDASNAAVGFVIAKNFFGSAFMVTPKGFEEAGMIGGPVCLLAVYLMEVRCMLNLIKCRQACGPGRRYEDLGSAVGSWFPSVITVMIMLCQFGFCCIWLVTNMENLSMVFPQWSSTQRLWIQLPALLPLVMIRHLRLFAFTNSVGILFTAAMVCYFFYFMGDHLSTFGHAPVRMINTENSDALLWLGSCAYAYEGINIVLPTYESARDKPAVPKLLVSITFFNTCMYVAFGMLAYAAFGEEVASLASLNLPRGSVAGRAIPMISVLIGLVSFPLQAFVIFQTYEPKLSWSSSYRARKWQKNAGRALILLVTFTATWLGGDQLQNFLGLVGGFCCASLALIFPSLLHLAICRPAGLGYVSDVAILICGGAILSLSTVQSLASWH